MSATPRPLRVLESFQQPRRTTNPYIVMLLDALERTPGLHPIPFSWHVALLGSYDVFHVHWPEVRISGGSAPRRLVRQALMALLLLRLKLRGTPVVRTRHNLDLPSGISRRERWLLEALEGLTVLSVHLNSFTPDRPGQASRVIPHGHYRTWYSAYDHPDAMPGRFSYFGLIRSYKGLTRLVDAFRELTGPYTLHIAGKPSSEDLAGELRSHRGDDSRIEFTFAFLTDAELVSVARGGEVVVLPYREMHNSGGVLAALSLGRPVLVPDNEVNRALAAEVGEGWVIRYQGDLTAAHLADAVASARRLPADSVPDLSDREWDDCGRRHAEAFAEACRLRRPAG